MRSHALLLLLFACAAQAESGYDTEALNQWRESRAERLVAEDGWTALIGLHWLDPARTWMLGSGRDVDLTIDGLPDSFGTLRFDQGVWVLQPADGIEVEVGAERRREAIELISDRAAGRLGISPTRLRHGPVQMTVIDRGERQALRVWSAQAPGRVGFTGLNWFDADPDWQVEGQWQVHEPPRQIEIVDVTGALLPKTNPGAVLFERQGREFRLEALAEPDDPQLFLIFADRSNGRESYGAGRYLYTDRPDDEGRVALDFNRAFNPPCAFSAYATCPLPPPENRVDLFVTAGERAYQGGPDNQNRDP